MHDSSEKHVSTGESNTVLAELPKIKHNKTNHMEELSKFKKVWSNLHDEINLTTTLYDELFSYICVLDPLSTDPLDENADLSERNGIIDCFDKETLRLKQINSALQQLINHLDKIIGK